MAGSNPSPLDLMLFHKLERDFYKRLVRQLSQNQERMKLVIALWLWFESIGHHDFIRYVSSFQHNDIVLAFVGEADACLDRLFGGQHQHHHHEPTRGDELPLTTSLMAEEVDLRFFEYHRDQAVNGVRHFFHNVCQIIFDDELMERVARDASHPDSRRLLSSGLHGTRSSSSSREESSLEGTSSQGAVAPMGVLLARTLPPPPRFMLNPMARPWSPGLNQSPEDQRSMFITFSRGHPISRDDIVEFFNARYGPCLEVVMIERAPPGQPPMYGRLVFTSASMIAVVLNGQRTAKFVIKGRHLWARMYMPRHN